MAVSKNAKMVMGLLAGGLVIGTVAIAAASPGKAKKKKAEEIGPGYEDPLEEADDPEDVVDVEVETDDGEPVDVPVEVPDDGPATPTKPPPKPKPPEPDEPTDEPASVESVRIVAGKVYRWRGRLQPAPDMIVLTAMRGALAGMGATEITTNVDRFSFVLRSPVTRTVPLNTPISIASLLPTLAGVPGVADYKVTLTEITEASAPAVSPGQPTPSAPTPTAPEAEPDTPEPIPVAVEETSPENDPSGSVRLARALLVRENAPGWKTDLQGDVTAWQKTVGLKPDGKFGLKSATRMAEEVGVLPLVRFWTKGKHWDKWSALDGPDGYNKAIDGVIAKLRQQYGAESDAHVQALEASKRRERAQGLHPNPKPNPTNDEIESMMNDFGEQAEDAAEMLYGKVGV